MLPHPVSVKVITELDGRPQASGCPRPLIRTGSAAAQQAASLLSPGPDFYLPPPLPQATRGHPFIRICHQSSSKDIQGPEMDQEVSQECSPNYDIKITLKISHSRSTALQSCHHNLPLLEYNEYSKCFALPSEQGQLVFTW